MPKKILMINKLYHPWIGGVEKHVQELGESLAKDPEYKVNILCVSENIWPSTKVKNNVKVKKLSNIAKLIGKTLIFSMPISFTFPFWLKRIKADIMHFHQPFPLSVISYLISKPKGKVVVTWHSDIIKQKFILFFFMPFLKRFLKKADVIIATSQNLIDNSKVLQKYKDKCKVVPLGINPEEFIKNENINKIIKEIKEIISAKIVLFIGRFSYYKGITYLIDAFRDINAVLVVIGSGALENEIRAKIRENKIEHKVIILKDASDDVIKAYYNVCEFLVLPSTHPSEAFGIVQIEAMGCGKPVISTNLPSGVPFVNQHEKTGLIVKPADSKELNRAIKELLSNDEKRLEYGRNAKKRVEEEFGRETMVNRIKEIYNRL